MSDDLRDRFEQAASDVQDLPDRPDNDTLLKLYALYKQGKEGDCTGKRPGRMRMVKRAKYDAWKARAGTSREDAMQAYVDLVDELRGD